jgi:glycyl-tRNA synthetase
VPVLLADLRLAHGEVSVLGTPRRLVIYVGDLATQQPDLEQVVKGPPVSRAFDALGMPTPAAEGFARSKGVPVDELRVREIEGGQYVTAVVRSSGQSTLQALAGALPGLITGLRFDKAMRWNSSNVSFSRPIRWLLALYGEQVVPFTFAGLRSGNLTHGLRFSHQEEIQVNSATDYLAAMQAQGIVLEKTERQRRIREQLSALSVQVDGSIAEDPGLMAEVANLVEAPAGIRGSFEVSNLELPGEVLISVMKKHQRYFPVEKNEKLLPYFIAITNRGGNDFDRDQELVVEGNEHVIRARFADAAFFIRDDLKIPLEEYLPRLNTLMFQTKLGSMLEKTRRIQQVTGDLIDQMELTPDQAAIASRAAWLCKADLVTKMVVEMTSLQGVIGQIYASRSGEPPAVAQAIFEHYLPRHAGDSLPASLPGLAVGLADRLDTLAGLFAAGLAPTGAKDPFGQRRAALGLVSNLMGWDMDFDLRRALSEAASHLPLEMGEATQATCLTFIVERLRNVLLENGFRYDIVDAVLASQGTNPARTARAVQSLGGWVQRPDWSSILPAYARCVRITRDQTVQFEVDAAAFVEPAERALYDALQTAEANPREAGSVNDFLKSFLPMIPAINQFFEEVLVMSENQVHRENRLGLLQRIAYLADGIADFSRLEGF